MPPIPDTAPVGACSERQLVDRLRAFAGPPADHLVAGIGDDAAALRPERNSLDVVTTDSLVEGVHFRRDWTTAAALGWKALSVNLSDLAAMGAAPRAAWLSLVLPADLRLADFDALVQAVVSLGTASGAVLAGGNLARSPGPLVIDVTALGSARPRRLLRRSGGRAGDRLFVTGRLGAAACGLRLLQAGVDRAGLAPDELAAIERYERPAARLRTGLGVARAGAASAAIDLSDGLADGAGQIALASGTGVVVDASAVPLDPALLRWAGRSGADPMALALGGGEDYELLFAVRPRAERRFLAAARRVRDVSVTPVGRLTRDPGAWLSRSGTLEELGAGFSHFTAGHP